MPEVIAGFFIVLKLTGKYIQRLERSLLLKKHLMFWKAIPKVLTQYLKNRRALNQTLTKDGTIG